MVAKFTGQASHAYPKPKRSTGLRPVLRRLNQNQGKKITRRPPMSKPGEKSRRSVVALFRKFPISNIQCRMSKAEGFPDETTAPSSFDIEHSIFDISRQEFAWGYVSGAPLHGSDTRAMCVDTARGHSGGGFICSSSSPCNPAASIARSVDGPTASHVREAPVSSG